MSGKLEIKKASITALPMDCIVNAANSALQQGGGVCGAIFTEAGAQQLRQACSQYAGCPTGSAVVTPGFNLKAKYIIHTVGPQWVDGHHGEEKQLRSAYQSALAIALQKGCRTVAFPLISSGIYGYPLEEAWDVAIRAILDFLEEHTEAKLDVSIAVLTDDMLNQGRSLLAKEKKAREPIPPHLNVCDMVPNTTVCGCYILQAASPRTTASGKHFLSASVTDRTGTVQVIFWDYSGPIGPADEGNVVLLAGRISEFKGALQISLDNLKLAGEEDKFDLSALIPVAPIDVEAMMGDILSLVDSLEDPDYQALCREFLRRHQQMLLDIPAAKSVHHSFLHGLLMHTGYMVKAADFLAGLYPEIIDRSLLITGTLLHDFAKREEFTFSRLGLVTDYSVKGQLLGHLVMGAEDVRDIAAQLNIPEEKSILLQHMLLSHHGKPEYGAAVVPMCAESELLSLIDMMDSRMEIYRENLEQTAMGALSPRVFALDGHRVYRHYEKK